MSTYQRRFNMAKAEIKGMQKLLGDIVSAHEKGDNEQLAHLMGVAKQLAEFDDWRFDKVVVKEGDVVIGNVTGGMHNNVISGRSVY